VKEPGTCAWEEAAAGLIRPLPGLSIHFFGELILKLAIIADTMKTLFDPRSPGMAKGTPMSRRKLFFYSAMALILALYPDAPIHRAYAATDKPEAVETIVIVRHGEKPPAGLGQLKCRGLNRALALPKVLLSKFGRPDYIFAANPSVQLRDGNSPLYSYVRPLATIEPLAIELGMPVNTQIGFNQIQQLQAEVTKPMYSNAVIILAWEHGYQDDFAKNLMTAYGGDSSMVPPWSNDDYDSIFVIRLKRSGDKTRATFALDAEGLNGKLSDKCPAE
jgi:hypothetical protein